MGNPAKDIKVLSENWKLNTSSIPTTASVYNNLNCCSIVFYGSKYIPGWNFSIFK